MDRRRSGQDKSGQKDMDQGLNRPGHAQREWVGGPQDRDSRTGTGRASQGRAMREEECGRTNGQEMPGQGDRSDEDWHGQTRGTETPGLGLTEGQRLRQTHRERKQRRQETAGQTDGA